MMKVLIFSICKCVIYPGYKKSPGTFEIGMHDLTRPVNSQMIVVLSLCYLTSSLLQMIYCFFTFQRGRRLLYIIYTGTSKFWYQLGIS